MNTDAQQKNLKETVKNVISKIRTYWKSPPPGKYMNMKEIASLATGGIGVKCIICCVQSVLLSVGNTFLGNTIGIKPVPMYFLYVLSIIASFPLTMLRAYIIDNTRSRKGKYKPYIIAMGLPTVLLSIGYFWMPYQYMSDMGKYITVLLFNIGFQFFYMFMFDSYDNYIVVLSPNTQERSNIAAIRTIADSIAPSAVGIIIPVLGRAITGTDNLFDIRIYKYIWSPLLILSFFISLIIYVNTEEKIIQARTHVIQIKFADALRAVAKNKYFWIISLAGWLGFLENAYANIIAWLYTYQHACSTAVYTIVGMIVGNASLWGMMAAPFAIKYLGKRKILIYTNILNIFFIAAMLPIVKHCSPSVMIWLLAFCMWTNALVGSFAHILTPSLNGDIRDYQQYITGERIDGMFAAVGMIGNFITMLSSAVLPALYKRVGFNEETLERLLPSIIARGENIADPTNVYNVLYDNETFIRIFTVLIIASVIGAFLNVLPYFWYDLTETKQCGMVRVLQIRALFEDYGNGVLKDENLVGTIDSIREAKELVKEGKVEADRNAVRKAGTKQEKKAARKAYRQAEEHNRQVEIAQFVVREINRFNTPEGKAELERAQKTVDAGYDYIYNFDPSSLQKARALPRNTEEEKAFRKAEIERAKDTMYARKTALKYFPDGIKEFDISVFERLFSEDDRLNDEIEKKYKELYAAKDRKDKTETGKIREEIRILKQKSKENEKAVKKATDENSLYTRASKPYINAKNLLTQSRNYAHLDDIETMYDTAKERYTAEVEQKKAEEERIEAEEKAYMEKIRAQKAARKALKKNK